MVSEQVKKTAQKGVLRLRQHPELFYTEILGGKEEHLWDKMLEVMHSVRDHKRTAVKAGCGVSKTHGAASSALEFLYDYGPDATVITTAPTNNQVENVLWREIRSLHSNAKCKLPGKLTNKKLDIDDRWFALGFSTKPDNVTQHATAFQGFHNKHVLVLFDEAAGVHHQIWEAAEGLITSGHVRFLVIGNPTSGYGDFADCFMPDSEWNQITISVLDTPNYKLDKEVIPGVSGRSYVESARRKYGENSSFFKSRVLGEIPSSIEGAIYAREIRQAIEDGRIRESLPKESAAVVHTAWDLGISAGNSMAIWFIQKVGPELHFIDYYEGINEGLAHYIKVIEEKRLANEWVMGQHFAPHDIAQRELTTNTTRLDTAKNMGINFSVVNRTLLDDGIEASRQIFNRCWFDKVKCKQGLKALAEYHWKRIESVSTDSRPVYSPKPEHDASSNGSDAFRTMAVAHKTGMISSSAPHDAENTKYDLQQFYKKLG